MRHLGLKPATLSPGRALALLPRRSGDVAVEYRGAAEEQPRRSGAREGKTPVLLGPA